MSNEISIIVVTYNSEEHIIDCLNSIFLQDDKDFEFILIDNNSSDSTISVIKDKFTNIHLIKNRENLGFSKGVNQGIECSKGKNIFILNSDIVLREDFIDELKNALLQLPDNVGMISPKMLRMDKQRIDSTGLILSRMRRFYDRGQGSIDLGQFDRQQDIFGPCAAAAIYTRQMLEDIKINNEYFDEDFFLILEDFDIAWRARSRGWKVLFVPAIICYHLGGISRKRSPIAQYYTFRNRYLLLLKNERMSNLWRLLLFALVYDIPRFVFFFFLISMP